VPLLFSSGTLQEAQAQLATFGRLLAGESDSLPGYRRVELVLHDPIFIALSGRAEHVNAASTGNPADRLHGTALEVTDEELAKADEYEKLASYGRIDVTLASGRRAWIYVHQRKG